jgi:hypothetical protein
VVVSSFSLKVSRHSSQSAASLSRYVASLAEIFARHRSRTAVAAADMTADSAAVVAIEEVVVKTTARAEITPPFIYVRVF